MTVMCVCACVSAGEAELIGFNFISH